MSRLEFHQLTRYRKRSIDELMDYEAAEDERQRENDADDNLAERADAASDAAEARATKRLHFYDEQREQDRDMQVRDADRPLGTQEELDKAQRWFAAQEYAVEEQLKALEDWHKLYVCIPSDRDLWYPVISSLPDVLTRSGSTELTMAEPC